MGFRKKIDQVDFEKLELLLVQIKEATAALDEKLIKARKSMDELNKASERARMASRSRQW